MRHTILLSLLLLTSAPLADAPFRLRSFMDGMMALGPVPVRHYREVRLSRPSAPGRS